MKWFLMLKEYKRMPKQVRIIKIRQRKIILIATAQNCNDTL